jgi:hypothetical protein
MSVPDYKYVLEDAKYLLDEIILSYRNYLRDDEIPRSLMNKIRFFLQNIESTLDYVTYHIFSKYCLPDIQEKIEWRKSKVSFPLFDDKKRFDNRMNLMFQEIVFDRLDIIQIFEKYQPYNTGKDYWLPIFNRLVNNSKHRELEKQSTIKEIQASNVKIGGVTIKKLTTLNFEKPFSYNGDSVDFENPNPNLSYSNVQTTIQFIFKESRLPVLSTLSNIYDGAYAVVNELEKIIEGN